MPQPAQRHSARSNHSVPRAPARSLDRRPIVSIAQRTSLIDAEWDSIALDAATAAKPPKPGRRRARVLLTLACALATSSALAATAATLSRERAVHDVPRAVTLAPRSDAGSEPARTVSAPDEPAEQPSPASAVSDAVSDKGEPTLATRSPAASRSKRVAPASRPKATSRSRRNPGSDNPY